MSPAPNLPAPAGVYIEEGDEELARKAKDGDREAFGLLFERHQRPVMGLLLSMLHDLDSAEDATQAAFIKAFQNLGSFEGRSSFRTWVTRIAINEGRSRLRWARLRRWLPWEAPDGERDWEERLRALVPVDDRGLLERKLELERALARLSLREREIAAMRLEGYSLGEIAQSLQVSEGTVKSTLFDATRKMRRDLT